MMWTSSFFFTNEFTPTSRFRILSGHDVAVERRQYIHQLIIYSEVPLKVDPQIINLIAAVRRKSHKAMNQTYIIHIVLNKWDSKYI